MRWSGEEIAVTASVGSEPPAPAAFVFQGRAYVVHEVLDVWRARTDWWRDLLGASDRAVGAEAPPGPGPAGFAAADLEERVWRVSASPQRARMAGRVGVYELGHARTWRLLRISD